MDDSDPSITYDANGVCHYVHKARNRLATECFRDEDGARRLQELVAQIKKESDGKPYDCIVGASGGIDSTYSLLRAKELGLRPLAVHLDNGWNSEVSIRNIERTLRKLDIDLYTYVVDWEEIKDLQRAYFFASVANVEAITDHAIFAILFKEAARRNTRFILNGSNVETEAIMPTSWGYDARDAKNIVGIHRRFGRLKKLLSYPTLSAPEFLWYIFGRKIRYVPILNYGAYNKKEVTARLQREFGWTPYARKHGESRFTRFFQEIYLPEKYHFDKRKAHFSSLIIAGQMTRAEALAELNKPLHTPEERALDIEYVTKKLDLSWQDWKKIMSAAPVDYDAYPNNAWMFDHSRPLTQLVRRYAKGEYRKAKNRQTSAG
jgi:N-acetyl sugar amidotransferase